MTVERRRLSQSAWDEEPDRPFVHGPEQVGVPQEKQPELGGDLA